MHVLYHLLIVPAGSPAQGIRLRGGGRAERRLIESVTDAVVKRGVGIFKTEAQVRRAIAEGFAEVLTELKDSTTEAE